MKDKIKELLMIAFRTGQSVETSAPVDAFNTDEFDEWFENHNIEKELLSLIPKLREEQVRELLKLWMETPPEYEEDGEKDISYFISQHPELIQGDDKPQRDTVIRILKAFREVFIGQIEDTGEYMPVEDFLIGDTFDKLLQDGWIKNVPGSEEGKPEKGKDVLIETDTKEFYIMKFGENSGWFDSDFNLPDEEIKAWQPLPTPYEGE